MKTTHSIEEVASFLDKLRVNADTATIATMAEGHTSQVFRFRANDGKSYVFRIRASKKDLLADRYAYGHFSDVLPIPAFVQIGRFGAYSYYCITEYIPGVMLNTLDNAEFQKHLPVIRQVLAKTFQVDISKTSGYGPVNFATGNGKNSSWRDSLEKELLDLDIDNLRQSAKNINLPTDLVDCFVRQFHDNLPYVSETRRLLHGDPGGDNVLVSEGRAVALLDWEQMAYGDWMRDFSRFSFWGKQDYGDALEFANEFNLEAKNIRERTAVYWAIHALRNIEFADRYKNKKLADWMWTEGESKLLVY